MLDHVVGRADELAAIARFLDGVTALNEMRAARTLGDESTRWTPFESPSLGSELGAESRAQPQGQAGCCVMQIVDTNEPRLILARKQYQEAEVTKRCRLNAQAFLLP